VARPATRTAHVPNASLSLGEVLTALVRPLAVDEAERRVERELDVAGAVLFASARGALAAAIEAVAEGDEVAVPAYTCAAVANAVLSAGKRPVYVDVDEQGLVPADAWPEGALALVQDTYGFAAALPAGRVVVRDAAHRAFPLRLGAESVLVTSFEHSKTLSAGRGGLAVTNDPELAARLRELRDRRGSAPPRLRAALVTLATLAMGRFDFRGRTGAGQLFRRVAWHLDESRLAGQSASELAGGGVDTPLLGRPDGTASRLIVSQLGKAQAVAERRRRIVAVYDRASGLVRDPLPLVRYPLAVADPADFEGRLEEAGWNVRGRWFTGPLHPEQSNLPALGYAAGSAPTGERLARTVVNLPTHPLVEDADAEVLIRAALDAGARPL
jgi:perosamine synthetase